MMRLGWMAACLAVVSFALAFASPAWSQKNSGVSNAFIKVKAGVLRTGDPEGDQNEVRRSVRIEPFELMRLEVTNREFRAFVEATGYRTDPERRGAGYVWTGRWRLIDGADWRHPHGPGSDILGKDDHPVVQVSARDAEAFCKTHRARLPAEEEWAFAARGEGTKRFPWGDERPRQSKSVRPLLNFGTVDCCAPDDTDGFLRTAPVGSYPAGASGFGHLDLAGNVWEWTSSPFPGRPEHRVIRGGGWGNNTFGVRLALRHGNPDDIGLDMVGFRCGR